MRYLLLALLTMITASALRLPSSRRLLQRMSLSSASKIYLHVPFSEKDEVKSLGARWDKDAKQWYVEPTTPMDKFTKWQKVYLDVPFQDRMIAKAQGAVWDPTEQRWYISRSHVNNVRQWVPSDSVQPLDSILLLDIDTTGLPLSVSSGKKVNYTDLRDKDTSRIVQVSWALCNKDTFDIIQSASSVVMTDGFPIPNPEMHGISESVSKNEGKKFSEVAKLVFNSVDKSQFVMAFNAEFDITIFKSELYRYALLEELDKIGSKREISIMPTVAPLLKLTNKIGGVKNPTFKEFVNYALQEDPPRSRNSKTDIDTIARSIQRLIRENKLNMTAILDSTAK